MKVKRTITRVVVIVMTFIMLTSTFGVMPVGAQRSYTFTQTNQHAPLLQYFPSNLPSPMTIDCIRMWPLVGGDGNFAGGTATRFPVIYAATQPNIGLAGIRFGYLFTNPGIIEWTYHSHAPSSFLRYCILPANANLEIDFDFTRLYCSAGVQTPSQSISFFANPTVSEGVYYVQLGFVVTSILLNSPMATTQSGDMFVNLQRTTSTITNTGTCPDPVRDPASISVGRCTTDTFGDYRYAWRIINLATGTVVQEGGTAGSTLANITTQGDRSLYAANNGLHTVDVSAFEDGLYRVELTVREIVPLGFPNDNIYHSSYGYFLVGDPGDWIIWCFPDEPSDTYITLRKTLRMPEGITPPPEDFTFNFNSSITNIWPPRANEQLPDVSLPNLYATFSPPLTTTTSGGYMYAYVEVPVNLSAINWPHPGIFTFRIYEEVNSSNFNTGNDFSVTYDRTVFYLDVHIGREDPNDMTAPIVVLGVNASGRIPAAGYENCTGIVNGENCTTCIRTVRDEHEKWELPFINHLAPSHAIFEVSKTVEGDMSDPNLPFAFTANFTLPDNAPLPMGDNAIVATITGYARVNGIINTSLPRVTESTVAVTSLPHSFNLRHGDIVTFSNMPIGTGFTVTEPNVPGYEQSGVAVAGGVEVDSDTADEGASLVLSGTVGILAATGSANARGVFNYVAVLNELPDEPPMGVFLSNVPFGLMVALGAGAMVAVGTVAIAHSKAKRKR